MSTKNFTITIVRTGDFVEVSFTPQEKITNGQRTVLRGDANSDLCAHGL